MGIASLVFIILGIIGIYVLNARPFSRKQRFPGLADNMAGGILLLISLLYFAAIYILPEYFDDGTSRLPCGSDSIQNKCYSLSEAACKSAWNSFKDECEAAASPTREKRPGAILSPIIYRCQAKKFDKVLSFNRKNEDDSDCQNYFNSIKE